MQTKPYQQYPRHYTQPGLSSAAAPLATKTECERAGCLQYCDGQKTFDPLLAATIGAAVGIGVGAGIIWAMKQKGGRR